MGNNVSKEMLTAEAVRLWAKYGGGHYLAIVLLSIWIKISDKRIVAYMGKMRSQSLKKRL